MVKKNTNTENLLNNALLNIITPMGLEFKRNSLVIGENTGKVYGIVKYPQKVDYGWLSKITNIPSTIVSVSFTPIDNGAFIESLSRSIIQNRGAAESAKDPLAQKRAERAALDGEKIMVQIDQNGETVGLLGITIMPISKDEEAFNKVCRKTESTCAMNKCKPRTLANLQEQAFKTLSPFYTSDENIEQIVSRIIPLSTFVGGFPFSSSGYNDGTGYYFGRDTSGGLIVFDTWKRGNDRTNTNMVIMGVAGVGKSTAVKHIALSEYMKGTKIIFVDPEREYKELCEALEGNWINAGGGSNGRINPLQIRPTPIDEDDEVYKDEGFGMGDMAIYIKNLEIFFNLYLPSLTDRERAILKDCIIELYNSFNITWDTDITKLNNDDFPIFSDLYELVNKKAKAKEKTRKESEQNIFTDLALLLKDIAMGSDSFLWNGHSSIKTNTRCVCLDTHDLQNTSDNIKRTQYFNILTWCWQEMSKDRNERVLLICDEAYLMIDPSVPQSLVFLRNVEKRARKYEAGVAIISHSVVDFLDPQIKMYGQALLDIPCFKIIMGTDGRNLHETKELYNLTDAEEELLASKKRGNALVMIGSKRLHVVFEIPEYKFEYMGKAGGR
ncbi:hypothetical protein J2Z44_002330 [Clostridium punense]|uniref:TraG P-loop domain-containing protein n=1 Tax=Clostridium punense TaxID=1054297 RepID=A0ABS4K3Z8_9CLOT|nr:MULTISPECIES: DUF87 domain-containing protein [Clostridium]EQB86590.1 hypothetical protein M918_13370 [Clostridium sp. BL8]MBP2022509.1 hypothetical protein [Clostridium punense]